MTLVDQPGWLPKGSSLSLGFGGGQPGFLAIQIGAAMRQVRRVDETKRIFERLSEFRYQLRRFLRFSEEAVHVQGITPLQYLLLLHIKGFRGRQWATIGELAERLQAAPNGVAALVSRCEAAGLVRRLRSDTDHRQVEVHLRAPGERCLSQLVALHQAELRSLAAVFLATGGPEG